MRSGTSLLLISILACTVVACAPPIGNITGASSSSGYDSMWVVPHRVNYNLHDDFMRNDLSVFASRRGSVHLIPIEQVTLSLIEDPEYPPFEQFPILHTEFELTYGHKLTTKGRKEIVVDFSGLSTRYSITVWDPYEIGGEGGQSSDGSGIVVVWFDDDD